jgi:hypothetical protein
MVARAMAARVPAIYLIAMMAAWPCAPAASQETPEAAANRMIGEELVWTARQMTTKSHRTAIGLSGPWGYAHIDAETGLLLSFSRRIESGRDVEGDPQIAADEAERVARSFLRRVGIEPDNGWTFVRRDYLTHGVAPYAYRKYGLEWKRYFAGIQLPAGIVVWVDADTGLVQSYMAMDDPVRVPLQASVTPEQAVAIVVRHEAYRRYTVESVRPVVRWAPEPPWTQRLVWRTVVWNPDAAEVRLSHVEADVDTTTGEIVRIMRPAGAGKPSKTKPRTARPAITRVNWRKVRASGPPSTVFQIARRATGAKTPRP